MSLTRDCDFCSKEYEAEQRYLNRGQGLFCSQICAGKAKWAGKSTPEHNVFCSFCNESFYLSNSRQKRSKSGLFFCCREHKDKAQKLGGIKEIMPPHYGAANGLYAYRKLAFDNLPNECAVCGWDEYPEVLEVNHKDLNRANNIIKNLEILCPTHHQVFHFLDRSGRWSIKLMGN